MYHNGNRRYGVATRIFPPSKSERVSPVDEPVVNLNPDSWHQSGIKLLIPDKSWVIMGLEVYPASRMRGLRVKKPYKFFENSSPDADRTSAFTLLCQSAISPRVCGYVVKLTPCLTTPGLLSPS